MRPTQQILILLCVLAMASRAAAYNEIPWPNPMLVQVAEVIVVGEVATERGKKVVRVSDVLKGESLERVVLSRVEAGKFPEVVIKSGNRGIFFLRKEGAEYAPFSLGRSSNMTSVNRNFGRNQEKEAAHARST